MKLNRIIRCSLLSVMAASLACIPAAASLTFPAYPTAPSDPTDSTSLGNFGACIAAEKRGQLVLLLDQSSSLERTDPNKVRTTAATYLVDQLAAYAERTKSEIEVQIAGFAADYQAAGWQMITSDTAGLKTEINTIADNLLPIDTDYVNALSGARRALQDERGDLPLGCQAIAWFTDGEHILDVRASADTQEKYGKAKVYAPDIDLTTAAGAQQASEAGKQELCRDGGTVDQVRDAGVTILGFGLASAEADLAYFTNAVTGNQCGSITEPPGSMFHTENPSDLLLAFDTLASPAQPPTQVEVATCKDNVCADGAFEFTLDNAISQVHVLATTEDKDAVPLLVTPEGKTLDPAKAEEIELKALADGAAEFTLLKDNLPAWAGAWQLAMVSPDANGDSVSKFSVRLETTIGTEWPDTLEQKARAGEKLEAIALSLVDSDTGEVIDPKSLAGELSVNAVIKDASGQEFTIIENGNADTIATPVDVDLASAVPGSAVIEITTTVTTAAAKRADDTPVPGTTLEPRTTRKTFQIAPAANFPSVLGEGSFKTLDGVTEAEGGVPVKGPGCVWLKDTNIATQPEEAKPVAITSKHNSADTCLSLGADEEGTFPLHLKAEAASNGAVSGDLQLATAPLDELTRIVEVPARFSAEMLRPLNVKKAAFTAVGFTVLGLIIPLSILYAGKYFAARIPNSRYGFAVFNARLGEAPNFAVPSNSEVQLVSPNGRSITLGPITIQAKMSPSPLGAVRMLVTNPTCLSIGSGAGREYKGHAVLPQNLASQWVVLKPGPGPEVSVVVILDGSSSNAAIGSWPKAIQDAQEAFADAGSEFTRLEAAQQKAKNGRDARQEPGGGGGAMPAAPAGSGQFQSQAPDATMEMPPLGAPSSFADDDFFGSDQGFSADSPAFGAPLETMEFGANPPTSANDPMDFGSAAGTPQQSGTPASPAPPPPASPVPPSEPPAPQPGAGSPPPSEGDDWNNFNVDDLNFFDDQK